MVCHAAPNYVCTAYPNAGTGGGAAGGCAADEMCPPQVSECHVEPGVPVCTPRYTLPCSADTDCGAGFSCKEAIGYVCHGGMSAGAGGASAGGTSGAGASGASGDGAGEVAGSGAPGEPWTCTEEPTGEFYCELQELACETDADCPGSLRCQENWAYECPGAGAGGGVAVAGAGGAIGTAGTTAVPPTEPEEPGVGGMGGSGWQCEQVLLSKSCAPDDYFPPPPGGMGGQSGSAGTGGAAGGGTINPPTMNPGTGGNAPGAGAGGAGGTTGGESGPSSGDGDDWLDHPRGRFGCAVAGDDASDALWSSLGLLGFAALILRRRGRTMI
jgi:MYXO-CTERM domain-containing protein